MVCQIEIIIATRLFDTSLILLIFEFVQFFKKKLCLETKALVLAAWNLLLRSILILTNIAQLLILKIILHDLTIILTKFLIVIWHL